MDKVCKPRTDNCQLKLLMETFHQALKKVLLDPNYNFNNKLKHQTKNRMMSEMRRYLDAAEYIQDLEASKEELKLDSLNNNGLDNGLEVTVNQTTIETQDNLDSVFGRDELEDELRNSLYCGNCDRFILKSYERRSQVDRKRKNELKKSKSTENWIERKTVWNHGIRIFHNEKNVHPGNVYKESMNLLNFRLKLRGGQQKNQLKDQIAEDEEERLNNVYDVHQHIPIKRSVDYHEVKIETRATWQPFKGLLQSANDPVLMNVGSLSGKHFRIGIVTQRPIINVHIDETGGCIVSNKKMRTFS